MEVRLGFNLLGALVVLSWANLVQVALYIVMEVPIWFITTPGEP